MTYAGQLDGLVLQTICDEPGPWKEEELLREFDSRTEAADALDRLIGRGLVMRIDGETMFASAAGRYAYAVYEETP